MLNLHEKHDFPKQDEGNTRISCIYNNKEQEIIKLDRDITLLQIRKLKAEGKSNIYDNQRDTANIIIKNFDDGKIINQIVLGMTQSGKTGTMLATIQNYLSVHLIPIENIYIITGLSSIEWKLQTMDRIPETIQKRVFHRNELKFNFVDDIIGKTNILIMMDEIQIASMTNQTIHLVFEKANLYNLQNLLQKNIKIIELSATPNGTLYDLQDWGIHSCKVLSNPGENYTSAYQLLSDGKIMQFKDICCYDAKTDTINKPLLIENLEEMLHVIGKIPKYHIIRTKVGGYQKYTRKYINRILKKQCKFKTYDQESKLDNINIILQKKPKQHTFILIKEKLRCAITLYKKHLGILYERYVETPDDSVIIQGLVGRLTGYDYNNFSICFTNIKSIAKYNDMWNSGFENRNIKWTSNTTSSKKGLRIGKTFNAVKHMTGLNVLILNEPEPDEPTIRKFKTQEEALIFYKKELSAILKGTGPRMRRANDDGFYVTTLGKGEESTRVFSTLEIHDKRKWNLNATHRHTFHPCYEDVTDKTTLEWWLIYHL